MKDDVTSLSSVFLGKHYLKQFRHVRLTASNNRCVAYVIVYSIIFVTYFVYTLRPSVIVSQYTDEIATVTADRSVYVAFIPKAY